MSNNSPVEESQCETRRKDAKKEFDIITNALFDRFNELSDKMSLVLGGLITVGSLLFIFSGMLGYHLHQRFSTFEKAIDQLRTVEVSKKERVLKELRNEFPFKVPNYVKKSCD